MLITCPSCSGAFELEDALLQVKATVPCPLCRRVVVIRDATIVPPGKEDGTVPFETGTDAALDPDQEATDVASRKSRLALPAGKRVSLAVMSGSRTGEVVVLDRPRLVIGRAGGGAGADLELPDLEMSRSHAALECHGSRIVLRDLGSTNGSYVGDRKVEAVELEDRAEFRLASTVLMLIVTDSD